MTAALKMSCKGGLEDHSCFFLQPPNDFFTQEGSQNPVKLDCRETLGQEQNVVRVDPPRQRIKGATRVFLSCSSSYHLCLFSS